MIRRLLHDPFFVFMFFFVLITLFWWLVLAKAAARKEASMVEATKGPGAEGPEPQDLNDGHEPGQIMRH